MVRDTVLFLLLLSPILQGVAATAEPAPRDAAVAAVRSGIEAEFRARTALGFSSFDCDLGSEAPTGFVECDAVDEEGDAFEYLLAPDDSGQHEVHMVTHGTDLLSDEARVALEAPCRRFLEGIERSAWKEIWSHLDAGLRAEVDVETLGVNLGPVREALGRIEVGPAETMSTRQEGRIELQYVLPAENGTARFRCGVRLDDPAVVAYLLDVEEGSEVFGRLFSARTSGELSRALGRPVGRVEVPVERLPRVGDTSEARAWLADGTEFSVRVERTGRNDDFHGRDFQYSVLDVPLLFAAHFRSRGTEVETITCPSRTVTDGTELSCTVSLAGGERRNLEVRREGGNYRILELRPISP